MIKSFLRSPSIYTENIYLLNAKCTVQIYYLEWQYIFSSVFHFLSFGYVFTTFLDHEFQCQEYLYELQEVIWAVNLLLEYKIYMQCHS